MLRRLGIGSAVVAAGLASFGAGSASATPVAPILTAALSHQVAGFGSGSVLIYRVDLGVSAAGGDELAVQSMAVSFTPPAGSVIEQTVAPIYWSCSGASSSTCSFGPPTPTTAAAGTSLSYVQWTVQLAASGAAQNASVSFSSSDAQTVTSHDDIAPSAALPEAPWAILVPLAGMAGGAAVLRRRRHDPMGSRA